ncbi:MAG: hypothetical protein WB778_07435 [Thermoplasmata archaeon]
MDEEASRLGLFIGILAIAVIAIVDGLFPFSVDPYVRVGGDVAVVGALLVVAWSYSGGPAKLAARKAETRARRLIQSFPTYPARLESFIRE